MEIKKLTSFKPDELGDFGYTSSFKYEIYREMNDNKLSITLELLPLEAEYHKTYPRDQDDNDRYDRLLPLGYSLGAYKGEELVGVVICEPQEWNNTLYIWDIQVSSEYRRRNIGRALLNIVTENAKKDGFRAIRLETQNYNVPAIRFYNECGFTIDGIDTSFYTNTDMETGEVALFMAKKL
ncbi:GNAT family N-acetyltransferase [Paenibacillus dokdonensis]|uniref:GNAT family N-acetyltransferase n=1 Tax=Paenibacillus dokdonensis TaxID=2567944 RepID=A0ABU6GH57_9BACL|nr:GNAT family N-acetyltransferase [Paenibacillus dokdonensis]MEC0238452.1 GNAT family N-acetyltransferase [Paenibacillus dokdonensis]